jgi:galactoside O-acetyltransferase
MLAGCSLSIGQKSIVHASITFDRPGSRLEIGARTFVGASRLVCAESISIGDDVLIAWGCTLVDHDSHSLAWKHRLNDVVEWGEGRKDWTHVARSPIVIADRAWVGFNVIILKGVTIGEEAVVGAGSVVTRDVPSRTVVAGNPARPIRMVDA